MGGSPAGSEFAASASIAPRRSAVRFMPAEFYPGVRTRRALEIGKAGSALRAAG
jgi:hypothetical protein